jgi:hypothetical protein
MTTGVVAAPPILQFTLNNGQLAVNGSILTQVGGVNTATYADSGLTTPLPNPIPLNSRGEISDANGNSKQLFLTPNTIYTFTLYDGPNGTGNQIWQATYVAGLGGEILAALLEPVVDQPILNSLARTAAEIAAGVTPTNYAYAPGDIRRYGASITASAAVNTAAIQAAQSGNFGVIYAPGGTFSYTVASVTNCTAYGLNALSKNGTGGTPGNNNTAFGTLALANLVGGVSNPTGSTAVGYLALTNSNGATNTAIGDNCMSSDTAGTDNTAIGAQALFSETTATGNNCFGFQCGYYITTGNSNVLLGNYAGGGVSGPGTGAGLTTGSNNIGVGGASLANLGSGSFNTAIGAATLLSCVNGNSNVALGYFAGTHANSSSEFYLDNQDRGSNANEIANALMYGNFGASAANNRLRINAQLTASVGTLCSPNVAPTIASAGGITPTAAITFVSGTTTVTNITQPSWMNNGGRITLIPTGVWAWNATGNIALAGTAVVGKALDFIWDGGTGKWYPSYIS